MCSKKFLECKWNKYISKNYMLKENKISERRYLFKKDMSYLENGESPPLPCTRRQCSMTERFTPQTMSHLHSLPFPVVGRHKRLRTYHTPPPNSSIFHLVELWGLSHAPRENILSYFLFKLWLAGSLGYWILNALWHLSIFQSWQ